MKDFLKLSIYKIIIVFFVIAADLITKEFLYLSDFTIIPGLIGIRSVMGLNTGGAFSMLSDKLWLLILATCIFIALICFYDLWAKDKNKLYSVAIAFIVGGAIGNFIDRIFLGGVRDFIFFGFWPSFPTFNVADSFLFIGTVLMVIYAIFIYKPKNEDRKKEEKVLEVAEKNNNEEDLHSTKKTKSAIVKTEKDDKVNSSKNNKTNVKRKNNE